MDDTPKLRRVRRLDSIRLDAGDRTYFTSEGYLVDHPILTSCGIFEYTNPDGSIRRELRLPEHVFAAPSLKTYKGKPIIITHGAGVMSKNNVDKEQIGTILSEGYEDGEDVRAEIIIHDTDAMKECGLKELSLGYSLDLVEEPGFWKGEPYDAVQTNIAINHLALVAEARAGNQARLNIDGSDRPELKGSKAVPVSSDGTADGMHLNPGSTGADDIEAEKEGGNNGMQNQELHADSTDMGPEGLHAGSMGMMPEESHAGSIGMMPEGLHADGMDMTPEELVAAIKMYQASKAGTGGGEPESGAAPDFGKRAAKEGSAAPPATDVPEKKDGGIQPLIAAVEQLLSALKEGNSADGNDCGSVSQEADSTDAADAAGAGGVGSTAGAAGPAAGSADGGNGDNADGSGDGSGSLNADSADGLFRQHLSICRVGDMLHMDGLENKSIFDGKKAIIGKVLPGLRLDGKDAAYINAAYDLAVCEAGKRKGVAYQRGQMAGNPAGRLDGSGAGMSMAASARQKMIEREGGNE